MLAKAVFTLLTIAGLLSVQNQSGPQSAPASEAPTVSLCSLFSKPADYDGKEVRVRVWYSIGFEWSCFDDPSCKEYAVETTPYRSGNVIWAEFDGSVRSSTKPEVYEKLSNATSFCCPDEWQVKRTEMVVTGKFFKATDEGYGHLGQYALKFVVHNVEEVGETKVAHP